MSEMVVSKYKLNQSHSSVGLEETGAGEEARSASEAGDAPVGPPQPKGPDPRRLHREEAAVRLQMLGKTAGGDSYAYLKVVCTEMKLTDISAITFFKQLLFVNVSKNNLTLENLQVLTTMPFLILIHADKNLITSAALNRMEYLQVIIMNHNQIVSCRDIFQPQMTTIELGYNQISKIEFDYDMPEVRCLDLRYNKIKQISGITFAKLESLYLAGNKIKNLVGLETLKNLKILHLRNNPIKNLNAFSTDLKKLTYINFRNCLIASIKQVKKLKVLPTVRVLVLKGTPYMGGTGGEDQEADDEEDSEQRTEVLAAVPTLERINKAIVSPEEREEALEILKNWIEEQNEEEEEEEEEEHVGEGEGEEKEYGDVGE